MTRAPIGYYVHHHGVGHVRRFSNIADASDRSLIPISELELAGGVRLPSDVVPAGTDPTAGGGLHWAPIGDDQSARRSLVFGRWLADARPLGVVVDVSVEASLLCRLFGVATIVVRQHGDRTDSAHELAYRSALNLLAPFPEELEHRSTPDWVRSKTIYAGFISDCGHTVAEPTDRSPGDTPGSNDIVILWGAGGGALEPDAIDGIVKAAGPATVWFVGTEPFDVRRWGIRPLGWIADVASVLRTGPTVIGSAGNNVVADAAAAGCALVVVPQARPFDEQIRHAESLDAARAAAVVDPVQGADWCGAVATARSRRDTLATLAASADGAAAAAHLITRSFATNSARRVSPWPAR